MSKELEDKLAAKTKEASDFAESAKTLTTKNAELEAKLAKIEADKRKGDFASFCEGLSKEGKLTPAMKPAVLDFMEILSSATEYEFSEGDGKVKAQPVDKFKSFLSGLPKQMEFSEAATKGKAAETGGGAEAEQREKAISDYQSANDGCDYKTAVLAVSKEHPELFREG